MKSTTKKAQGFLFMYNKSKINNLDQAYKNYSAAKGKAYKLILMQMQCVNGYDFRITGFNCMKFSCAYKFKKKKKEFLVYHTADNEYLIEL